MTAVTVSAASMRQPFHGCEPDYIRDVCKGACCRSSVDPSGVRIRVLPVEVAVLRARGAVVIGDRVQPVDHHCPFQTDVQLCGLHGTPDKPFGCIASPFVLTSRDTLVVRNRYRLLKCFRDGDRPAHRAFHASLVLLFGAAEAARISAAVDAGSGNFPAEMRPSAYASLRSLEAEPAYTDLPD